jgi:hypothetical protein
MFLSQKLKNKIAVHPSLPLLQTEADESQYYSNKWQSTVRM